MPSDEALVRSKSKAEVNLLRLAGSFKPGGNGSKATKEDADEAAPEWRKLEAYARRMRELLGEVRRGDTPPPAEYLAEYERMLSTAAAAADDARRKQDDLPRTGDDDRPAEVRLPHCAALVRSARVSLSGPPEGHACVPPLTFLSPDSCRLCKAPQASRHNPAHWPVRRGCMHQLQHRCRRAWRIAGPNCWVAHSRGCAWAREAARAAGMAHTCKSSWLLTGKCINACRRSSLT